MAHTLNDYLTLLERESLLAAPVPADLDREQPIALVSCDSRTVVPGTLFVCKGAHFKAEFLDMAQSRGAVAYASEKRWPDSPLPCILLSDLRRAMALMADLCYDHPSGKLKVIGFTGTKGKSSATYYLKSVLDAYRSRQGKGETGVISSIDTYDGAERFESHLTTPEPLDLQRHLAHAAQAGLEYLTMEVSSQALKYHRSLCTEFAAACFLNIGYDHISPIEHPDFQDYFASKLKIFGQAQVNCVNLDCDHAPEVLAAAQAAGKPVITFSQKNPQADVYASSVRKEDGQTVFQVRTPSYEREFRLTMPGLFNVENALGVIAVCEALHIPDWAVYDGLVRARVPGRMEVFSNADGSVQAIWPSSSAAPARRPSTAATTWGRPPGSGATGSTSLRRTAARRTPWPSAGRSPPTWKRRAVPSRSSPTGGRPSAGRCWTVSGPPSCCSPARVGRPAKSGASSISTPPPT